MADNNRPVAEWIVEIQQKLECIEDNSVKAGSICRVPKKMKEAEAIYRKSDTSNYRPQLVAMGPFHRDTTITSDLINKTEATKCRFMHDLLSRPIITLSDRLKKDIIKESGEAVKGIGSIIRESYREKIEMGSEDLYKTMLLDAFFLEFFLRLVENNSDTPLDDPKWIVRVLTDLMLLENQIPFNVLKLLSMYLFKLHDDYYKQQLSYIVDNNNYGQLSPQKLAELLLGFSGAGADFPKGVYHFLHLIHLCSPDPYPYQKIGDKPHLQLRRCATKLQYLGITITATQTNHTEVLVYTDGAFNRNREITGCGGLLKKPDGDIHEAFMCLMEEGEASIVVAKLWGCIHGLRRAWEAGFRAVKMFCDAADVISGIRDDTNVAHHHDLFNQLRDLMGQEWKVDIELISRVMNEEAVLFAKQSLSQTSDIHVLTKEETISFLQRHRKGIVADALRKFQDRFEFEIKFNPEGRELIIPTLHIKEATEVKWSNLIAWEQCGLDGVGYKFTSYAYFFKGLVSSCHDIQLLKEKGVIKVHKEMSDEDLLIMFQSITDGAEGKDGRYREMCKALNEVIVSCGYMLKMPGHYISTCSEQCDRNWRHFLIWLRHWLKRVFLSFQETYLSLPWKFIGVLAAAAILGLTITQTIYTIRGVKK